MLVTLFETHLNRFQEGSKTSENDFVQEAMQAGFSHENAKELWLDFDDELSIFQNIWLVEKKNRQLVLGGFVLGIGGALFTILGYSGLFGSKYYFIFIGAVLSGFTAVSLGKTKQKAIESQKDSRRQSWRKLARKYPNP